MTNAYEAEGKFLTKNYKSFLFEYLQELKHNTELHLHPPPAFRDVYKLILRGFVKPDDDGELSTSDLITMMDMVAKFMTYLNRNAIDYDSFSQCSCTRLSDEDLIALLESGGENR